MNIVNLLIDIEKDYNHPWPNEDRLTKEYRLKMLSYIRNGIIDLQIIKNNIKSIDTIILGLNKEDL